MPNIRLTIAYDGTRYGGWQIQKNTRTIQGEIEEVLGGLFKERIRLIAASRTDAGVHARMQVANFIIKRTIEPKKIKAALNTNLPKDICIIDSKKVNYNFHSRYHAKSKVYKYTVYINQNDDPFRRNYYYRVPYALNMAGMKKAANAFLGKHDFKSFQAKSAHSKIKDTTRTIKRVTIKKEGLFIGIEIEANGFLYNMVRNIVGTLIEVGRGRLPKDSMKRIIDLRDRREAGPTAPAKGLTLFKVKY
ncbi:MAG: tRNA pseudouridine(38-40) synthase TruA [Candidatus Omnitrophota bacterium]